MQRHFFPGGNTPNGFYSFYGNAIDVARLHRLFILKGGPGVGKSTLMKRAAQALMKKGILVEHLHCSSDPESLDGIVAPAIGLAIVDGTKPHMIDPVLPGAVDSIVNLGECLSHEGLKAQRPQIEKLTKDIQGHFQRAYRYLRAAQPLKLDAQWAISNGCNEAKLVCVTNEMLSALSLPSGLCQNKGHERKLFLSALTPLGYTNYLDAIGAQTVFELSGPWGAPGERVLSRVRTALIESGEDIEGFYCPMDPSRLEHIFLPKRALLLTTKSDYLKCLLKPQRLFNLGAAIDYDALNSDKAALEYDLHAYSAFIDHALLAIHAAKRDHDKLEEIYIGNMDFKRLKKMQDDVIKQCISMA